MRSGRVLPLVAVALMAVGWTSSAQAEEFPDLPGMGAASRAVTGQEAPPEGDGSGERSEAPAPGMGTTSTEEAQASGGASADAIRDMPGMGASSVISAEDASASLPSPGVGLEALAGLGTLAALGALAMLKRLGAL